MSKLFGNVGSVSEYEGKASRWLVFLGRHKMRAVRWAGRRASEGSFRGQGIRAAGSLAKQALLSLLVAVAAGGIFGLVSIYTNGLRDARYLDGWVLTGMMGFQLYFHIARKTARLSPKSSIRWRKIHICLGYLLIAVFLSHSDFSLPDTAFEWALWTGFVLVTISGIFGTYLTWSLRAKGLIDESVGYERIPARRADLARDAEAAVSEPRPAAAIALPASPNESWINDLYVDQLRDFFQTQQNSVAHLVGSQRPLKRLTDEIDHLSRYVDLHDRERLSVIRKLIVEKDRLDFAHVHLGLTRAWLFVHVPVTYSLIVLTVLHIVVVYAYSSGLW